MKYSFIFIRFVISIAILTFGLGSAAQMKIVLRKSFIDSFKNRVTISADYAIYFAHESANPAVDDGDLHFAGYDKKIGLPIVAEMMNAKDEDEALDTIQDNEGDGAPLNNVDITGVWRLWAEHIAANATYSQGMGTSSIHNTNPNHVFEIHPVTKLKDIDLTGSLKVIPGYTAHKASKAFSHYLSRTCTLTSTSKKITIKTKKALYNYCDFWIKLNTTDKYEVSDGLFVYCTVLKSTFHPNSSNVASNTLNIETRMAFVKDSGPYNQVKDMNAGEYLHVIGIPRISLNIIAKRVKDHVDLTKNLPFEMIVVGIIN